MAASAATWTSKTTGTVLSCKVTEAKTPAKDYNGKVMTVVYLENLGVEKIGQLSNAENVAWLTSQGYRVIEVDYKNNAKAVSPNINDDIIAINDALNSGSFGGATNCSADRSYILFEGYRIMRDVSYYKDDPSVYNYPDAYKNMEGDSLYMDIVYPANPSKPVATLLSFSYSNSYAGTANEGYTKKYQHKRMFLGYTFSMFDDAIIEGAPGIGMAWAIADHPKYCDWGRGNRAGGAQKEFGAIEINPDAARKVKSAIRTVRGVGKTLGLGDDVALYGFSRGSTAASLAIGDAPFADWQNSDRGRFAEESSTIQAAVLGPGVFDYAKMVKTSNEYIHMTTYSNSTSDAKTAWAEQGGALAISNSAAPCFLFYNSDDDANYDIQMKNLVSIFDAKAVKYELLKDYGKGHSVPQKTEHIQRIYDFLSKNVSVTNALSCISCDHCQANNAKYSISGKMITNTPAGMIYINNGKKFISN